MSSWWQVDGEDLRNIDASKEIPSNGGIFDPLPNNTKALAIVESAGVLEYDGARFVEAKFEVIKPEGYAGRKLRVRMYVFDDSPSPFWPADKIKEKRHTARTLFAKLDACCGGKLAKSGKIPVDEDVALAFTGKQVIVRAMLIEKDGEKPVQWFKDFFPKGSQELSEAVAPKPKPVQSSGGGFPDDDLGDDVPFD